MSLEPQDVAGILDRINREWMVPLASSPWLAPVTLLHRCWFVSKATLACIRLTLQMQEAILAYRDDEYASLDVARETLRRKIGAACTCPLFLAERGGAGISVRVGPPVGT